MLKLRVAMLLWALVAALALGCGTSGDGTPLNTDDDPPLSSHDSVFAGAPANDTLPDIGKADAVYPKKFTDLLAFQSPVKNQASRGVCTVFSTMGLVEHLYLKKGFANPDFSEQYLQWAVKTQVGDFPHTEGSSNQSNLEAVSDYGIVEEALWPYETSPWSSSNHADCGQPEEERPLVCFTNGEPPAAATGAQKYKLPRSTWLSSKRNNIKAHMTSKKTAVVVGVDFFYQAWNHGRSTIPVNSSYMGKGYVLYPSAKDVEASHKQRAGHGILLVGWDDDVEIQKVAEDGTLMVDAQGQPVVEKGFYIFKNSWGTGRFGVTNPYGPGYGYISQKYIDEYANAVVAGLPAIAAAPEDCNDEIDNNGDGKVDCDDPTCAADPACTQAGALHGAATPAATVPDNTPAGVTSDITLTSSADVATVKVTVDVTHTYVGDLVVKLTHGGETVALQTNEGGSADDLKKTFTVTGFAGAAAGGVWTLQVIDTASIDTGTLNAWSIDVTTP